MAVLGALTVAAALVGTALNLVIRFTGIQEAGYRWVGVAALSELIAFGLAAMATVGAVLMLMAPGAWRWAATLAVVPWLVFGVISWPMLSGMLAPERAEGGRQFSVIVQNLWYEHQDPQRTAEAIAARDADVVVLVEYTPEHAAAFRSPGIMDRYEHRWEEPMARGAGIAIFSKLPIPHPDQVETSLIGLRTELDVGADDPVTLIAVHPVSPANMYSLPIWQEDMRALTEEVANAGPTTVVAGDFNSAAGHRRFRELLRAGPLRDALDVGGAGFIPTWPLEGVFPALFRLDHILVGEGVGVVDAEVLAPSGSDHRGVAAVLQVPRS